MSHQGDRLFKVIRKAVPRSSIIDCLSEVRLGANLQLFLEPNGFRVKHLFTYSGLYLRVCAVEGWCIGGQHLLASILIGLYVFLV